MNANHLTPPAIEISEINVDSMQRKTKQPYIAPKLESLGDYSICFGQVASLPVNP
jgi:hypothetical protein